MNIYPAIDLKSGKCVRLYQGSYNHVTQYDENPITQATSFAAQGAKTLHVVDLDGAKEGAPVNLDLIVKIKAAAGANIQSGGGIRTKKQANTILTAGIDRIIVGSIAISKPDEIKGWIAEFGPEKIVLALDIRLDELNVPKLALHGWLTPSEKSLWDLIEEYQNSGLKHVLCTDIGKDGTLSGPNFSLYQECVQRYPDILFQASGGISQLQDLQELSKIPVSGAIIGKALYENKFTLLQAISEVNKC